MGICVRNAVPIIRDSDALHSEVCGLNSDLDRDRICIEAIPNKFSYCLDRPGICQPLQMVPLNFYLVVLHRHGPSSTPTTEWNKNRTNFYAIHSPNFGRRAKCR